MVTGRHRRERDDLNPQVQRELEDLRATLRNNVQSARRSTTPSSLYHYLARSQRQELPPVQQHLMSHLRQQNGLSKASVINYSYISTS